MTRSKGLVHSSSQAVINPPDPVHKGRAETNRHIHEVKPVNPASIKHDHKAFKGVRKESARRGNHPGS